MRVFVTGASGHIGSAVVPSLIKAGHSVTGLARSSASAAVVGGLGAAVCRGDLGDPDGLRAAVADFDAVVHLAFDHATMLAGDFDGAAATDLAAVRAMGSVLAGKTFIGVGVRGSGSARGAVTREIDSLGAAGVRTVLVGIPPVTHSRRDTHGFIPMLIKIARETGVSGYVDSGDNRWPAGHTVDVASLYPLALSHAPAGAQLFAAAESGIPVREIASVVGRRLGVPVVSVPAARAVEHFRGFPFVTMDVVMDGGPTRSLVGWAPSQPGLIADLEDGHYFG